MTPRTHKVSLFFIAAAIIALSTFTTAVPVPLRSDQLVISPEDLVLSEKLEILVPVPAEEPDHDCGHDESDYETFDDEDDEEDEDDDEDDEDDDEEEESTEEDIQAAGEAEDDYYIGQTYTGLVFDSETGKGIALTTVDPDQDLLELALFLRRKKITSFEEIWNDAEEKDGEDDGLEDDENTTLAVTDINDIESVDDDEEDDDAFESET